MTIILIKVKTCHVLSRVLLACIHSYLKSVLSYTFLISDAYHPDIIYLRELGYEDKWSFYETKRDNEKDRLENTNSYYIAMTAGWPVNSELE